MRKSLLLMSAAALGLAMPAMAQDTSSTKSPPAPNSANSASPQQPTNSLPVGGATATDRIEQPGAISTTPTTPMAPQPGMANDQGNMTGMQPMRHPHHHRYMAHRRRMNEETGEITHATGAGPGEPESRAPSNIDRADTHSDIAPALPMPPVRGNSPEAYLAAANRALEHHQGGEAQEALERAETRLLDRSVPAGQGNMPERDPRLAQIHDARIALSNRDWNAARQSIQQAMNMGGMGMERGGMERGGMMRQPGMGQGQMMGQPGMNQPMMNQGNMNQPGMAQPANQPMMNQPGMNAPAMNQGGVNTMPPPPGSVPPSNANGVTQ
ncbi:MAG: hypothetical protein JO157_00215 [Acetobacteraceae bacterium]|nr:hypothetical protein [Acetobacteraceae bacterium]